MEEKGGTKKRENQYEGMKRYETPKDGTRMSNTPDLWLEERRKIKKQCKSAKRENARTDGKREAENFFGGDGLTESTSKI